MAPAGLASDTPQMEDRTGQLIDRTIGIAGAACGIGLAVKIVGWVAGVQDLDLVGNVLCAPVAVGVAAWAAVLCIGAWATIALNMITLPVRVWVGFRDNT